MVAVEVAVLVGAAVLVGVAVLVEVGVTVGVAVGELVCVPVDQTGLSITIRKHTLNLFIFNCSSSTAENHHIISCDRIIQFQSHQGIDFLISTQSFIS